MSTFLIAFKFFLGMSMALVLVGALVVVVVALILKGRARK